MLAKLCGFVKDDDYEHKKKDTQPLLHSQQPKVWNPNGITISTPILVDPSSEVKSLENLIDVKIHTLDNYKSAFNKSLSIHERYRHYKIIQCMSQTYRDWKTPTTTFKQRTNRPLFIYMGTVDDGQIFGCVLDEGGNCMGSYFEPSMNKDNVAKLWGTLISLYDRNGSIQSVTLFDSFYIASQEKDRLPNGASLREIWNKELETFFFSEVSYEHLGFTKNLYNQDYAIIRSSMPSFACLNRFDGQLRANKFYKEKGNFVWYIHEGMLELVRTATGESLKKVDITNKSSEQIARIIVDNE